MSIQEHLNKIRNAIYGREVRESIAKGIETAYDDASEKDNANMEVKIARGTHPNLRSRLEEVDDKQQQTTAQLAQKATKGDIGLSDLNKNKLKLNGSWFEDEFLEDLANNEINTTYLEDESVSTEKLVLNSIQHNTLSNELKTVLPLNERNRTTIEWEYGSMDNVDGADASYRTDRMRSQWFIVDKNTLITNDSPHDVKMALAIRDDRGTEYIGFGTRELLVTAKSEFRMMLAYEDNREIENFKDLGSAISIISENMSLDAFDEGFRDIVFPRLETSLFEWEYGTLLFDGQNGSVRTDRLRTDSITVAKNVSLTLKSDDIRLTMYKYDSFGIFLYRETITPFVPVDLFGEHRVRFVMYYEDDREIENIDNLTQFLEVKSENKVKIAEGTFDKKYNFVDELFGIYTSESVVEYSDLESVTHDEVYGWYNELIGEHPEYGESSVLGKGTNDLNLNMYRLKPKIWRNDQDYEIPKVVITTGTHGDEKSPVYSTYLFVKKLCEEWHTDKILEFFRFNVEFIIVPVVNPSGFNANTRLTANNVDLNRDFPTGGIDGELGTSRQPETYLLLNLMSELQNQNVELWVDFHNMWWRDGYTTYATGRNPLVNETMNRTINMLGRKWKSEYEFFPQDVNHEIGYTTHGARNTVTDCVNNSNMRGVTLEITREIQWEPGWSRYNKLAIQLGLELLVNSIKGVFMNI